MVNTFILTQKCIARYLRYDDSHEEAQEIVVIFSSLVLAKESVLILLALEIFFLIIKVMDRRGEVAIMID